MNPDLIPDNTYHDHQDAEIKRLREALKIAISEIDCNDKDCEFCVPLRAALASNAGEGN